MVLSPPAQPQRNERVVVDGQRIFVVNGREGCANEGSKGKEMCVCNLVFYIPLHAARRAMAAVVGFSIGERGWRGV